LSIAIAALCTSSAIACNFPQAFHITQLNLEAKAHHLPAIQAHQAINPNIIVIATAILSAVQVDGAHN
jgi:hypothetical protein